MAALAAMAVVKETENASRMVVMGSRDAAPTTFLAAAVTIELRRGRIGGDGKGSLESPNFPVG